MLEMRIVWVKGLLAFYSTTIAACISKRNLKFLGVVSE
jgi:hypothetical protein